jgi:prolyl 4-hydroxylase
MISEVFYVEDFIPNHLLDTLISWAIVAPTKKDSYNHNAIEFLQLSGEEQNIAAAFAELNELTYRFIEKKFMCSLYMENVCSMVVYRSGSFLPKHIDNVPGQNLPTPTGNPSRDISSTLYYNDNYSGGEIVLINQGLEIKPKAGSLILFPSNENYPHEVLPVIFGDRYCSTNFWSLST